LRELVIPCFWVIDGKIEMTKRLLEPFQLHDLSLSNRIVMAPMTRARAGVSRVPNALMAEYYAQRSTVGLIITEATTISEQGNGWVNSPGIYSDEMAEGWKGVVDAIHSEGGKVFLQLWHCGRASHSNFHHGKPAVAPSAIAMKADYIHTPAGKVSPETPRALETDEIQQVVADYERAARSALSVGFDGIEIHAANGYLIDTFLQSKTNHRTDQYGGSIENRFRFLREIVERLTQVWPSYRVGVRLSPNGVFNDMGSTDYREQFTYAASQLDAYSLSYLHVMDGLGFGFHGLGEPMTLSDFRSVYHGVLIGNCGYTIEDGESKLQTGAADLVAYGRPLISNPDLVARIANDWPLAEPAAVSDWYGDTGAAGYTTYPMHA
jgi:N-ethylmaleimide reductase